MNRSKLENITKICKALSDPTRLKIFLLLTEKTLCVNAIVRSLEVSQPAVSQHLRILREAGLVYAEKRGYWMHYSANKENVEQFMGEFNNLLNK
ncbi:winged helix-turn-helix transcriptional regulator [Candidatus Aerophobetes bacterium]|nr:winged helix-turn-helix transcriptional regulator [Candidatus Aerophobetes bacterium]